MGLCRVSPSFLALPLLLTGCGLGPIAPPSATHGLAIHGKVHGGQQPIAGAHIYLFATNTTGYGGPGIAPSTANASISLLDPITTGQSDSIGAYVTTAADGSFSISNDYACTPGQQVYLYALGGNPQGNLAGPSNPAAGLLAILGNCPAGGNFVTATPFIFVNEVTTVAAAYAFAGFASDATHVSNSGTSLAQTGIANAFANAANLADIATGTALTTTPAGNGTVPQTEINTLANILASCINSTGAITGPTNPTTCYTLFNNALSTPSTGTIPTDTATAALNIAHNPGSNIANLYVLPTPTAAFAPALSAQPSDFTMALTFKGAPAGMDSSQATAIDGQGNIWASNITNKIAEFNALGAPVSSSSGYTSQYLNNPVNLAFDTTGNVWVANGNGNNVADLVKFSSSGAFLSAPANTNATYVLALDASNNIWLVGGGVIKYDSTGNSPTPYTTGVTSYRLAIDNSGNVWLPNYNSTDIVVLSSSGVPITGSPFSGSGLLNVQKIAFDASDHLWALNINNSVSVLTGNGTPITGAQYNTGSLYRPVTLALDGSGAAWVLSTYRNPVTRKFLDSLLQISNSGTTLSPSAGYIIPGSNMQVRDMALDGSGNIWIDTYRGFTEYVGASVPVVTPLVTAVANNTFASRP
jgi:hypothetical protein